MGGKKFCLLSASRLELGFLLTTSLLLGCGPCKILILKKMDVASCVSVAVEGTPHLHKEHPFECLTTHPSPLFQVRCSPYGHHRSQTSVSLPVSILDSPTTSSVISAQVLVRRESC